MKKNNEYIDISLLVSDELPLWPGSSHIEFKRQLDLAHGDIATDTVVSFSVHTGTHIDAPLHFVPNGKSVEQLSLDVLIGDAYVAHVPDHIDAITSEVLDDLAIPMVTDRLLLRTRNSQLWQQSKQVFEPNFVALTTDAAQWVVDRGICLIGIDYLSVQRFSDGPETHQILLEAEVVILEGLNLIDVKAGCYELLCLPIKLKGVEGAPARVLLRC